MVTIVTISIIMLTVNGSDSLESNGTDVTPNNPFETYETADTPDNQDEDEIGLVEKEREEDKYQQAGNNPQEKEWNSITPSRDVLENQILMQEWKENVAQEFNTDPSMIATPTEDDFESPESLRSLMEFIIRNVTPPSVEPIEPFEIISSIEYYNGNIKKEKWKINSSKEAYLNLNGFESNLLYKTGSLTFRYPSFGINYQLERPGSADYVNVGYIASAQVAMGCLTDDPNTGVIYNFYKDADNYWRCFHEIPNTGKIAITDMDIKNNLLYFKTESGRTGIFDVSDVDGICVFNDELGSGMGGSSEEIETFEEFTYSDALVFGGSKPEKYAGNFGDDEIEAPYDDGSPKMIKYFTWVKNPSDFDLDSSITDAKQYVLTTARALKTYFSDETGNAPNIAETDPYNSLLVVTGYLANRPDTGIIISIFKGAGYNSNQIIFIYFVDDVGNITLNDDDQALSFKTESGKIGVFRGNGYELFDSSENPSE